ncbi:MAG: AMP-binding protein, partial [Jatrophihabitantaceae bacterium]
RPSAGLDRGGRVAVLDKNHPACIEVLFAAGSIGAAVGILNWRLAAEELAFVINDCAAEIVFVGHEFIDVLNTIGDQVATMRQVVVIDGHGPDSYQAFLESAQPAQASASPDPDDLLMLMYSSGTTGHPKGVMLSHRAVIAHTRNVGSAFPFEATDINLVAMPLFHVGGTCYALIGIAAGIESMMTREPDAASLGRALHSGSTHAFFVPPVIAAFLDAGGPAIEAMAKLRYLGYGAAPMPLPLLEKALATWPGIEFIQVYGQTEVAGVATILAPSDHHDQNHPEWLLSAGTAVPGCEIRIVDIVTEQDVAAGDQGEIWLRTEQRMTGYLNQVEASAATITSDGWLRTGDVGRLDDTGHLFVEDRLKDMIITGGENVYGPEVERVLLQHPAIADVAVIGIPDEQWGEAVHAVVVTSQPAEVADIISFCRQQLAGYKCPRTVEFVDALPRNASGKILKRQLRNPHWADRGRAI